jgi:hypothetical protein
MADLGIKQEFVPLDACLTLGSKAGNTPVLFGVKEYVL